LPVVRKRTDLVNVFSCINQFTIESIHVMFQFPHLYPSQAAREGAVQEAGLVGQDGGALQDDGVGVQTRRVLHHHKLCAWRRSKKNVKR